MADYTHESSYVYEDNEYFKIEIIKYKYYNWGYRLSLKQEEFKGIFDANFDTEQEVIDMLKLFIPNIVYIRKYDLKGERYEYDKCWMWTL